MAAPIVPPPSEPGLHVDRFGLSLGPVSVGLPRCCTADDVLGRYLELLRLVGRTVGGPDDLTAEHVDELAAVLGTTPEVLERRLLVLARR